MRVLIKAAAAPDAMRLATRARPVPGPGELLLRVEAVGICGTDLSLYAWHQEIVDLYHPPLPLIMGHEFSGRVVSVGPEVAGFLRGSWLRSTLSSSAATVCIARRARPTSAITG